MFTNLHTQPHRPIYGNLVRVNNTDAFICHQRYTTYMASRISLILNPLPLTTLVLPDAITIFKTMYSRLELSESYVLRPTVPVSNVGRVSFSCRISDRLLLTLYCVLTNHGAIRPSSYLVTYDVKSISYPLYSFDNISPFVSHDELFSYAATPCVVHHDDETGVYSSLIFLYPPFHVSMFLSRCFRGTTTG